MRLDTINNKLCLEAEVARRTKELETQRDLLYRIIDNATMGMSYLTPRLIYRWVNAWQAQLLGIPPEEMVGKSVFEVFGLEAEDQIGPLLRAVLETGQMHQEKDFAFAYTLDGKKRRNYWDFAYIPVFEKDSRLDGLLVLSQEVSDRVEKERLQKERLDALEQADALKDQFLSTVTHELRTPLNAITGFGSILRDGVAGDLTAAQIKYLDKMLAGSETLLQLINELLDLSAIRAGKFQLSLSPIKLGAVAVKAIESLRALADEKNLEILNHLPAGLPMLQADGQRIRQVLVNLIGNAVKFTQPGGMIEVKARLEGDGLVCEVQDNGIGIALDDIVKLFRPFSQIERFSTGQGGGSGLGLSICKAYIEAHGGQIGVHSEKDRGSTFWFSLPLATGK